jgi:hypothetical protein
MTAKDAATTQSATAQNGGYHKGMATSLEGMDALNPGGAHNSKFHARHKRPERSKE